MNRSANVPIALSGAVALTLLPLVAPAYYIGLMIPFYGYAIALLGFNLLFGYTGLLSFGHAMFLGIGAYGAAIMSSTLGVRPFELTLVAVMTASALIALPVGALCVRYTGIFFGMLTLALSMVFYGALLKTTVLGGSDGFNVGRPTLFGIRFVDAREADFMLYAVAVVATGLAAIAAKILFRSEFGLASLAVRENNLRVEYLGISANRVIAINFVIAATFAGASGAFSLMAQRHIDPQFAYWTTSGEFVFVAVLAGYQSVSAVFVASLALELVRSFSNLYLPNTWQLVLGSFLLAVILFLPRGIGSLWTRERRKTVEPAPPPSGAEEGAPT